MLSKVLVVITTLICITSVRAMSVESNAISIEKGKNDSIDVYATVENNVTNVDFNLIYSTYDVVAVFSVNPIFTDAPSGIRHSVTLGEHEGGKIKIGTIDIKVVNNPTVTYGTVSITNPISKNLNFETKNLNSQVITVNVAKKDDIEVIETPNEEEFDNNLLKEITSKIVNIKLKKDVFKYEVNVSSEIKELDLKPIAIDDNCKINISSQKINEIKDNKISIKVTKNDIESNYEITVNVEEEEKEEENIYNKIEKPSVFKYKGKWLASIFLLIGVLLLGVYLDKNKK